MTVVQPFEYRGFVLLPELITVGANCNDIGFVASGTCFTNHITEFKKYVDEVLTEQKVDFNMKEYYKQLDRLVTLDRKVKFQPLELRREIIEIHNLFSGVLKFSLEEVKQHYFERANKGEE